MEIPVLDVETAVRKILSDCQHFRFDSSSESNLGLDERCFGKYTNSDTDYFEVTSHGIRVTEPGKKTFLQFKELDDVEFLRSNLYAPGTEFGNPYFKTNLANDIETRKLELRTSTGQAFFLRISHDPADVAIFRRLLRGIVSRYSRYRNPPN